MANPLAQHGASLFPILPPVPLSGLARMVAEARDAGTGHEVEFRMMEVRSVLCRSTSKRGLSLAYAVNPYRGCEFGCRYCYARYTHEFLASKDRAAGSPDFHDPEMFEQIIFLKKNAAWLLDQELRKIDPADEIALGTATDPYQPVERKAQITRSLLEVFARRRGYRLGIVTKSTLILRDLDLLTEIQKKNRLVLHLTITTPDASLARLLEPRAPRPDLRFATVKRLRKAGLTAGILCSPLLPAITDSDDAIDRMAELAAAADASFFAAEPLFLKSCSRPTFLSFVREHYPHLAAEYEKRFGDRDFAEQPYRRALQESVRKACRRHGVNQRSTDALLTREPGEDRRPPESSADQVQSRLFA